MEIRQNNRPFRAERFLVDLLKKIKIELEDIAQVDQEPSLEGRQLLMVLSPLKRNGDI